MLERSISELVREFPGRARIFEQFAIEYRCGNNLTLAEVCQQQQIDPERLLESLKSEEPVSDPFIPIQLGALSDEIVARHHSFVREQGERILPLLARVNQVHIKKEPRLLAIWSTFEQMHTELLTHMLKEENVLFPFCKRLEQAQEIPAMHCGGSIMMPIRVMESEHRATVTQMQQIQSLTDDFCPPEGACNSWRVLYSALKEYVEDLEEHMHLENDLLFPAAARREEELHVRA